MDPVVRGEILVNKFKVILVGHVGNHTKDAYKLYNPESKRVILSRDIN